MFLDQFTGKTGEASKRALPYLVQLAYDRRTISYNELGKRIGIHHRHVGNAVGWLGTRLIEEYESRSKRRLPPIQTLVVNMKTRLPGSGADDFIKRYTGERLNKRRRSSLITAVQEEVFEFDWQKFVRELAPNLELKNRPAAGDLNRRRPPQEAQGSSHRPEAEIIRIQGKIIAHLVKALKKEGYECHKERRRGIEPDLVVGNEDALIEVKSSCDLNSIYAGIGQLLCYSALFKRQPKLVLFARIDERQREFFVRTASSYGVTIIGFSHNSSRINFNKDALLRALAS